MGETLKRAEGGRRQGSLEQQTWRRPDLIGAWPCDPRFRRFRM